MPVKIGKTEYLFHAGCRNYVTVAYLWIFCQVYLSNNGQNFTVASQELSWTYATMQRLENGSRFVSWPSLTWKSLVSRVKAEGGSDAKFQFLGPELIAKSIKKRHVMIKYQTCRSLWAGRSLKDLRLHLLPLASIPGPNQWEHHCLGLRQTSETLWNFVKLWH